jgi:pimeloyl-ACP methyl ester carboxylesterase
MVTAVSRKKCPCVFYAPTHILAGVSVAFQRTGVGWDRQNERRKLVNTQPGDGRLLLEGSLELHYRVLGDGEPIIFVHGGPGLWHDYFRPHMDELADAHRLVFFDQRGGGRSAAALTPKQAAVGAFVDDIERLREGLGLGRVNVLGHSWGGLLGLLYAARYPGALRSLVVVDSAAPTPALMMKTMTNRQQRMAQNAALMELARSAGFQAREPESLVRYLELMDADSFADPSCATQLQLRATGEFAAALFAVFRIVVPADGHSGCLGRTRRHCVPRVGDPRQG